MSSSTPERGGSNLTSTALYVGVPVLIGASCYYLYHSNKNKSSKIDAKKDSKKKQLTPKEQLAQLKQTGNHNFSKKNYDIAIENYTKAIEFSETLTATSNSASGSAAAATTTVAAAVPSSSTPTSDNTILPNELAIFYQNRAACHEAKGDFDKVVLDCDQAIALKENYIKAYVRRAKAYEKLGKYDKAMVDAFSANLLEKFQNQANMILTENIVKASSKLKAAEAMKDRKPSWPANQAIKSYLSAFTQDPIREKLPDQKSITAEQLEPILVEANKPENDNDPLSLLIRGSCLSLMNDQKAANEAFDKLLELDDEICSPRIKSNAIIKKAAIVISEPSNASASIEKDLERVIEMLEQAAKIDPENPDIYLHRSQALALSERLDDAIKSLDKAIELKPDFHSAIAQKLYVEFKVATKDPMSNLKKIPELLLQLKQAVEENPTAIDLLSMYAQILTEMNEFEQADQVFLDIAKLDPTDGNVHVSRALLQFHMKNDADEVATLMNEALKIDPKIMFAYEILGSIESQRGKIDEAIKIFETALQHASTESDFTRCYGLLDSAISQKTAAEVLKMQSLVA